MNFTAAELAVTLAAAPESSYVRIVADWLRHGEVSPGEPRMTGLPIVDALVAAATAHLARREEVQAPEWTSDPARQLSSFWHPGGDRFFAYSLAHTPAEFFARGVVVEHDSLASI